jgi:hypothetical protein
MQYKKKEYRFNILFDRIKNDKDPSKCVALPYTDGTQILHLILDYSKIIGTEKFTRETITNNHLFSKLKDKKLSSHYDVFNKEFEGDKKKLIIPQKKPLLIEK